MRDNRVLLVGLPTLLTEILEQAIENASLPVVSAVSQDLQAVEQLVGEARPTAVVFGVEPDKLPEIARRLWKSFPDIALFTLSDEGRLLYGAELRPVVIPYGETSIDELVRYVRDPRSRRMLEQ